MRRRKLRYQVPLRLSFLLIFLIPTASIAAQSSGREISLNVVVIDDHGRVAVGLKRDWFGIVEKRSQLKITGFETAAEPASVVILFDLSNSVPRDLKRAQIQAVTTFVTTANPNNEYLVVGFNTDVNVIADWGQNLAYIEKQLSDASERRAKDGTALYDACDLAIAKLASRRNVLHVLLVVSDGQDNASKLTFVKLREQLKQTSAITYAIALSQMSTSGGSALSMEGQGILDELTSVTAGSGYYPRTEREILAAADHISFELSNQYRIRFKPPSIDPDGKWHPIKIKLTLPETDEKGHKFARMNVRSREGYYDR